MVANARDWLSDWRALHQEMSGADLAGGTAILERRAALLEALASIRFSDLALLAAELEAGLRAGEALRMRWQEQRVVDGAALLALIAEQQSLLAFSPGTPAAPPASRSWLG